MLAPCTGRAHAGGMNDPPPVSEANADAMVTALLTASRLLVAVTARSFAQIEESITLPKFRLLICLSTRGPLRITELAEELECNPSTATRMANRLQSMGLIGRYPLEGGGALTALTPKGQRIVDQVTDFRRKEIARIIESMPFTHQENLIEALQAFTEAGGEPPASFLPRM